MSQALSAYRTTYVISEAEMITALENSGVRADTILAALAPYALTPNSVPTPVSEYADTYDLTVGTRLELVMGRAGPRATSFFDNFLAGAAA